MWLKCTKCDEIFESFNFENHTFQITGTISLDKGKSIFLVDWFSKCLTQNLINIWKPSVAKIWNRQKCSK